MRHECFEFDAAFIISISNCCVLLHNMLAELRLSGELEDEYDGAGDRIQDEDILAEFVDAPDSTGVAAPVPSQVPGPVFPWSMNGLINSFMNVYDQIIDRDAHIVLRKRLPSTSGLLKIMGNDLVFIFFALLLQKLTLLMN